MRQVLIRTRDAHQKPKTDCGYVKVIHHWNERTVGKRDLSWTLSESKESSADKRGRKRDIDGLGPVGKQKLVEQRKCGRGREGRRE